MRITLLGLMIDAVDKNRPGELWSGLPNLKAI